MDNGHKIWSVLCNANMPRIKEEQSASSSDKEHMQLLNCIVALSPIYFMSI